MQAVAHACTRRPTKGVGASIAFTSAPWSCLGPWPSLRKGRNRESGGWGWGDIDLRRKPALTRVRNSRLADAPQSKECAHIFTTARWAPGAIRAAWVHLACGPLDPPIGHYGAGSSGPKANNRMCNLPNSRNQSHDACVGGLWRLQPKTCLGPDDTMALAEVCMIEKFGGGKRRSDGKSLSTPQQ